MSSIKGRAEGATKTKKNNGGAIMRKETLNAETIAAVEEVQRLITDPNKKVYNNFEELLADMDLEDMRHEQ